MKSEFNNPFPNEGECGRQLHNLDPINIPIIISNYYLYLKILEKNSGDF